MALNPNVCKPSHKGLLKVCIKSSLRDSEGSEGGRCDARPSDESHARSKRTTATCDHIPFPDWKGIGIGELKLSDYVTIAVHECPPGAHGFSPRSAGRELPLLLWKGFGVGEMRLPRPRTNVRPEPTRINPPQSPFLPQHPLNFFGTCFRAGSSMLNFPRTATLLGS